MQPTNCSVRNVVNVNIFDIEIIDAYRLYKCISIKISHCSYRQFFLVQNIPINNKNRIIQHIITYLVKIKEFLYDHYDRK